MGNAVPTRSRQAAVVAAAATGALHRAGLGLDPAPLGAAPEDVRDATTTSKTYVRETSVFDQAT